MPFDLKKLATMRVVSGGGGVPLNNQDKSITQNGTYTADEGYTGLGTVKVNVARDDQTGIEEQFIRAIERNTSKPVTELPAGLTSIGSHAFYKCTTLALTELPVGLTRIGEYAFHNCTTLALTELPAGLTRIDSYAFNGCSTLALTELPAGLTRIDSYAFNKCTNLLTITFRGKPESLNVSAFPQCSNLRTINVPWAEGEVSGAPWGATNATINYNHTGV